MELFRGDTFYKKITSNDYTFKVGDQLHIAVLENSYSNRYLHEQVIKIESETSDVVFEIPSKETSNFPVGILLLEIELTSISDIVKTNQYELTVKADGIYERN
jgi:hypothetical protein